ncbi:MAG: tetratricopeptide repeat protein [Phycisphaerae bacterium]|nr:tetratricopeptide repeat protein [Phycisphaerae bacterium]
MSYLLEALGRGLLSDLRSAFENQLPGLEEDESENLRRRATDSPKSGDLALRLGLAYLREIRLCEAEEAFETARQIEPSSAKPLLGLACVCDELGQYGRALKYLSTAHARDPNDPALTFAIAFCQERMERIAEAQGGYRRALELCPELRNAYERLAAIAIRNGEWAEAINQYERLAEMDPGNLDTLLILGNIYLQAERPADAIDQYQQALFIEPQSDSLLSETENLDEDERLGEAIQTLEKLVRKSPGMAPFHVHLGDLYVKAGRDLKAIEQYHFALDTQPNFLEATVKLGTQHMRQGRYVDAALTFNRAVELNDRLMTAFVGLGVAQHACGREHESAATLDLAASLEPSTTLLFSESARLHVQTEQRRGDLPLGHGTGTTGALGHDELLAEAVRRHQQALMNSPGHADLHYRYGLLLRQVGRQEEAIETFRNAVAINPNYSKAQVKLAICLKECGRTDEAIEAFQQALRLDEKYVDVHYQLGLLFAQRSRFDLAVEQFEQAVAGNDRNLAFQANLALALQNIGMVDRAAATWRSICELSRSDTDLLAARERILRNVNEL